MLSASGSYVLDGQVQQVHAGHAMLTRPGSTRAIHQGGNEGLALLLACTNEPKPIVTPAVSPMRHCSSTGLAQRR